MAYSLPAAFPAPSATELAYPGFIHRATDVGALVQAQNWLKAYMGRGHVAQAFYEDDVASTAVTPTYTQVLTYLVWPRVDAQSIRIGLIVESNAATDTRVRVTMQEAASSGTVAATGIIAAGVPGALRYGLINLVLHRFETRCTLNISLSNGAAATTKIRALAIWDADLTAVTLRSTYYATLPATAQHVRYWPLQEGPDGRTGVTGEEILGSADDLIPGAAGETTVASELLNYRRLYRREFASGDWLDATWQYPTGTLPADQWSVIFEARVDGVAAGQRTIISTGADRVIVGASAGTLQLQTPAAGPINCGPVPSDGFHLYVLAYYASGTGVGLFEITSDWDLKTLGTAAGNFVGTDGLAFRVGAGFAGDAGGWTDVATLGDQGGAVRSVTVFRSLFGSAVYKRLGPYYLQRGEMLARR